MMNPGLLTFKPSVALRKESVDRNAIQGADVYQVASLSARRAWIEIKTGKTHRIYLRRSPQGERG